MQQLATHQEAICALATAPGGALGIVRVSGSGCIDIVEKIFFPPAAKRLSGVPGYTLLFGSVKDEKGEVVDDVLASVFRAPHSYTGEDAVELSCHGSPYILQKVMQLLVENGCRTAEAGEFTKRAFLNGKMDLSQAEAVADLIASSSRAAHRMAMNQMRGAFSRELAALRDELLRLASLMELELDFSDHEDLEFADRAELERLSARIEDVIARLAASFATGNAIKNGIPVVIIGETNAGKSTLLNALLGEERAIVSDIQGTTRDSIEDTASIGGRTFRFIDTAGIRDTADKIETLGIERAFSKLGQAEIVIWALDATCAERQFGQLRGKILPACRGKRLILLHNKADLLRGKPEALRLPPGTSLPEKTVSLDVSAKNGQNMDALRQALVSMAAVPEISAGDVVVANARHYEALTRALAAIRRVRSALSASLPGDLVSQDLRECIGHLSEITGDAITTSDLLKTIFEKFCVGK